MAESKERELVERWVNAVAAMHDVRIASCAKAVQDAGVDQDQSHWRRGELPAFRKCVAGGNKHDDGVRGSVLHACINKAPFGGEDAG